MAAEENRCLEAVRELGRAAHVLDLAESSLRTMARELWGQPVQPHEFAARLWSDLSRGRLVLRDGLICSVYGGCVEARRAVLALREYTRASGALRRALHWVGVECAPG